MLKQRVITGIILLPVVIALVFAAPNWFLASVFGLILLIGADELVQLAGWNKPAKRAAWVLFALGVFVASWMFHQRPGFLDMALYAALGWLVIIVIVLLTRPRLPGWLVFGGGLLMLVTCWISVTAIHGMEMAGRRWLMLLLLFVWAVDVGGYFGGKRFGKHRMAPSISPGKTWEGVAGGVVGLLLVALSWSWAFNLELLLLLALGGGVIVVAIIGDLFESLLKRQAGVKDSGSILPGHGGILDRLDSLIVTAPAYVFVSLAIDSI